jgi:predicted nucleic acid-binding protein
MIPDRFVVDSSVGIKWFVPEVHSAGALRLRAPGPSLHAPTFFDVEMGNILWKKVQRAELTLADAAEIVGKLPALPLSRHSVMPLIPRAFDLACETNRTVYDSLYLALAIRLDGRMVTADQRLVNALTASPYASHVCWVEDLP